MAVMQNVLNGCGNYVNITPVEIWLQIDGEFILLHPEWFFT